MTTEANAASEPGQPLGLQLNDLLGRLVDVADAGRVLAWAREKPRRPAQSAFTAGPERQAAYWIEWAEAAERERCALVAALHSQYPVTTEYDKGYDKARADAAAAIRRA